MVREEIMVEIEIEVFREVGSDRNTGAPSQDPLKAFLVPHLCVRCKSDSSTEVLNVACMSVDHGL